MSRKVNKGRRVEELCRPRRVPVWEAKTHLSNLLDEVERTGRAMIITRHGKDLAELRRPDVLDRPR